MAEIQSPLTRTESQEDILCSAPIFGIFFSLANFDRGTFDYDYPFPSPLPPFFNPVLESARDGWTHSPPATHHQHQQAQVVPQRTASQLLLSNSSISQGSSLGTPCRDDAERKLWEAGGGRCREQISSPSSPIFTEDEEECTVPPPPCSISREKECHAPAKATHLSEITMHTTKQGKTSYQQAQKLFKPPKIC